ncbi:PilC/PilY family type IV pilus protein, partial [uncultured Variovorax sp.]|uniref:pilus assembly protein n=1 Tax=uncultured Variovorax sp. TaxID=114708 RepID=UPI0025F25265
MKMRIEVPSPRRAIACSLMLVQAATAHAAPYALAQAPRNTAVREPAPNVIVSVDNSGSMWGTGMAALKAALRTNFSEADMPNGRIRLAWQAMNVKGNNCTGFFGDSPGGPYQAGRCSIGGRVNANLMRPLDSVHRRNFMSWIDSLDAEGVTPLHIMMTRAGEYMKTEGRFSPYSDDPGVEGATQSSCRRSFHIFMTDGDYGLPSSSEPYMPAIGNEDGTHRVLPDSVAYIPRAPYRDNAGSSRQPTLADMTFHYWATDLQPGISNNVKKIVAEAGEVTVREARVPEYWNPKNDPATWQHLTTYTIGFGDAASWFGEPAISAAAAQPSYSGDYARLVDGTVAWMNPFRSYASSAVRMDLWHAALNSRGTFTPASNAKALGDAFKSILSQILDNTGTALTSISASASRVSTGTAVYQAGYDTADWSGTLTARRFGSNGLLASSADWSAREQLDARMATAGAHDRDRKVLTFSGTEAASATGAARRGAGTPFRWAHLSDRQKNALKGSAETDVESTASGRAVLDFLRGDRSNEDAGRRFRKRGHVLGDIAGSSVWYAGQPRSGFTGDAYALFASVPRAPMVYVGANDGMLHAFNAATGKEEFAYVPAGLYGTVAAPILKKLSEGGYTHRYYVDGSPFVADIYMGPKATATTKPTDAEKAAGWRSLLVGTLGAGGKGYFVLDVTKPENIDESGAASVALLDTTALADDDLGHQLQQPVLDAFSGRATQVALLNNDRRALILGNGYNSNSEKALLWIQYLDGDKAVLKIPAPALQGAGTGNGLSAPRPVDRDGDGKVDLVYAGDLLGNLWKFDLNGSDSSKWKATLDAVGSQRPATTASTHDDRPLFAAGAGQPITAAPVVVGHPRGGYMVVFGTGRLFASGDERSTADQYLYG